MPGHRRAIEEPVDLRGRMRVHDALDLDLPAGPGVDHRIRDFDFWGDCNNVISIDKSSSTLTVDDKQHTSCLRLPTHAVIRHALNFPGHVVVLHLDR